MPLPAIALLAVGAVAVLAMSKKKDGTLRALDGQCRMIRVSIESDAQFQALMDKVQKLVLLAYQNVTGIDPTPYLNDPIAYFRRMLGDPPGDIARNSDFCQAVGTELLKMTATPACLKKMGIALDYGSDRNQFGPDWTEWGENAAPGTGLLMGDTLAYFKELIAAIEVDIASHGYDIDMTIAFTPDTPRNSVEKIARGLVS